MSQDDKSRSKVEQAKGRLKEMAGKITGDDRLKGEGRAEQVKGRAREGVNKAEDTVRGAVEGLRGKDRKKDGDGEGGDDRA